MEDSKRFRDLDLEVKRKHSEVKQRALAKAYDFLTPFKNDLKDIQQLQGNQRLVRLSEIKKMLFMQISASSLFNAVLDKEYSDIFQNELLEIYNAD